MTYRKVEGAEYQQAAERTRRVVAGVLEHVGVGEAVMQRVADGHGFDGGPVIQGALGAVLQFAVQGDLTPSEIRAELVRGIDEMLPQFVAHRDARRLATTTDTGNA
jgi:hypothetical protein